MNKGAEIINRPTHGWPVFQNVCIMLNTMVVHATALVAGMCVISCNYIFSCFKLDLCQTVYAE